jgi:hypothetical protein
MSPPSRHGSAGIESWVAIQGRNAEPIATDRLLGDLAAGATITTSLGTALVVGSVLPWRAAPRHAPALALPGESSAEMFARVLDLHVSAIEQAKVAHPEAFVLWAGDFNQSLDGPNLTGTKSGRDLVEQALDRLGLVAWNRGSPHALAGMCAIDLFCGPASLEVGPIEVIAPVVNGRRLSDHAGYVIDLSDGSESR